ncbi:hypothetical protein IIO_04586 [Bacillus cereus VD115]|nr:hypothetical protein IIO_04586 [Bacillus cereus VD115]
MRFECRRMSVSRYSVLNRRYNEKIVDISGETIDIFNGILSGVYGKEVAVEVTSFYFCDGV